MDIKWNGEIETFLKIKEFNTSVFLNGHKLMFFDKENELHKINPNIEIVVTKDSIKVKTDAEQSDLGKL